MGHDYMGRLNPDMNPGKLNKSQQKKLIDFMFTNDNFQKDTF